MVDQTPQSFGTYKIFSSKLLYIRNPVYFFQTPPLLSLSDISQAIQESKKIKHLHSIKQLQLLKL